MEPWYPPSAWERTMKIQEVFGRAEHGSIAWNEAAEILGVDPRTVRRWKGIVEEEGFKGLLDKRRRRPSSRKAPETVRHEVLSLYRDLYHQWNVKHFHEKLREKGIRYSYTWVKDLLQQKGLVQKVKKRAVHRRKRARRSLEGMMIHIDGSEHAWVPGLPGRQSLILILDDATSRVLYAKLVPEEDTRESMLALWYVVRTKGLFCSVYSDRASHFFHTPIAKGKVDPGNLTQIGRVMQELGIQMIPAYSPEARGRSERCFGTWQGRLPNELKLHGIHTIPDANRYIREVFMGWHNKNLTIRAADKGSAFVPHRGRSLDYVFCLKEARQVGCDNTVRWNNLILQLEPSRLRGSFAQCRVTVCEHLDGMISILYGQHVLGRYTAQGERLNQNNKKRTNHVLQKADILISY
jgi:transposase